jgi:hypothetical protein
MNETPSIPTTLEPTQQPWIAPKLKKLTVDQTENTTGTLTDGANTGSLPSGG